MRLWISATAAKSRPNTGLAAISTLMSPASSRASTARCTLPPDRLRIGAPSPCVLTPYSAIHSRARLRHGGKLQPARRAGQRRLVEVAQRHVLGHAEVADAGVAQRLLRQAAHLQRAGSRRAARRRARPSRVTRARQPRRAGRPAPRPARAGRCPRRRRRRGSRPARTCRLRSCTASVPRSPSAAQALRRRSAIGRVARPSRCIACSARPTGARRVSPSAGGRRLALAHHRLRQPRRIGVGARGSGAPPCRGAAPSRCRHRPSPRGTCA